MYAIDFEKAGIYEVTARVATATAGGVIELSIDGHVRCSIPVSSQWSEGWQDWYTSSPLEAAFDQGTQEVKLTFKGGEGYLFNLNWFDLSFKRTLPASVPQITEDLSGHMFTYPLMGRSGIGISYELVEPALVSIRIINLTGQISRVLMDHKPQSPGSYKLTWDGNTEEGIRAPEGIYLLVFEAGTRREVQKVLYIR
jgi:hypothetical protein